MADGSIIIRPQSGDSLGVHCDGKVGPNIGMRAPAMLAQKVAHNAMAHGYGIQYPSLCQVIVQRVGRIGHTLSSKCTSCDAVGDFFESRIHIKHLGWNGLRFIRKWYSFENGELTFE